MDNPAVFWSVLGIGTVLALVGGFFLVRVLSRKAFDNKIRQLFETGQHELAVERLSSRGRKLEAAEMLIRWGKTDRAAQIFAQLEDWARAAELSEKGRQWGTAAVYHIKASARERAAYCYGKQGRADKAAEIYRDLGMTREAIEALQQAGDHQAAAALVLETQGLVAAVSALKEGGQVTAAADLLRSHGEVLAADTLLANHYDTKEDWEAAAAAYEALGQMGEAAERYRRAGKFARAGEVFEQQGRLEEAKDMFLRTKSFDRVAQCFEKMQNFREAARHYLLAGLMKQAVDNLRRADDMVSIGEIYQRYGHVEQALTVLNVAQQHPQYREAHTLRARILERQGDLDGARNELIAVVTRLGLGPATVDLVFAIAEIYIQQNDLQNALRMLQRMKQRGIKHRDLDRRINQLEAFVAQPTAAKAAPEIQIAAALPQHERYEFLKKLGQGGMGAVYKARDTRLGRIVAIKLLLDSDLPSEMAKKYFFREAQTVSVLNHPNIVVIYDFGEIDTSPYIAMEYIEGTDLEHIVTGQNRILELPRMVKYCSQLAQALDFAHQKKIIHRDVKLGNVMVTKDDHVKLMDFGLAKAVSENPDRSLMVIGTPYYMAPEQIAHEDIDHRVDIYALGILMFRLVTGRLPFESGDVLRAQRFEPPPDPASYVPTLPKPLCGLILHCLEKRPEDRPERAEEVSERLLALPLPS